MAENPKDRCARCNRRRDVHDTNYFSSRHPFVEPPDPALFPPEEARPTSVHCAACGLVMENVEWRHRISQEDYDAWWASGPTPTTRRPFILPRDRTMPYLHRACSELG